MEKLSTLKGYMMGSSEGQNPRDVDTLDMIDELHDVIYELSAVFYALSVKPGFEMSGRVAGGFSMIIDRQIKHIEAIADRLDP